MNSVRPVSQPPLPPILHLGASHAPARHCRAGPGAWAAWPLRGARSRAAKAAASRPKPRRAARRAKGASRLSARLGGVPPCWRGCRCWLLCRFGAIWRVFPCRRALPNHRPEAASRIAVAAARSSSFRADARASKPPILHLRAPPSPPAADNHSSHSRSLPARLSCPAPAAPTSTGLRAAGGPPSRTRTATGKPLAACALAVIQLGGTAAAAVALVGERHDERALAQRSVPGSSARSRDRNLRPDERHILRIVPPFSPPTASCAAPPSLDPAPRRALLPALGPPQLPSTAATLARLSHGRNLLRSPPDMGFHPPIYKPKILIWHPFFFWGRPARARPPSSRAAGVQRGMVRPGRRGCRVARSLYGYPVHSNLRAARVGPYPLRLTAVDSSLGTDRPTDRDPGRSTARRGV